MATITNATAKMPYLYAYKCEQCGKVVIRPAFYVHTAGTRETTIYSEKKRQDAAQYVMDKANTEIRDRFRKFETEVNEKRSLAEFNYMGKCDCGHVQCWEANRFLSEVLPWILIVLICVGLLFLCSPIIHFISNVEFLRKLTGNNPSGLTMVLLIFLGIVSVFIVLSLVSNSTDKRRIAKLQQLQNPYCAPLIFGPIEQKKIIQNKYDQQDPRITAFVESITRTAMTP